MRGDRRAQEAPQPRFQSHAIAQIAFPYDQHVPIERAQRGEVGGVARDVSLDLGRPIGCIALGSSRPTSAIVPMPPTTMDEDYFPPAGENQVRPAGKIASMKAKSKP